MDKNVSIKFVNSPNAEPTKAVLVMDAPEDLPEGLAGQVLMKGEGGESVSFEDIPAQLPTVGTTGHVLTKTANGNEFAAPARQLPSTGTTGHVLMKTEAGNEFAAIPAQLPVAGTTGHVLTKTEAGNEFAAIPLQVPAGGVQGQVLAVGAEGAREWVNQSTEPLPVFSAAAIALLANGDYKLHIVDGVPTWVAIV